MDERAPNDSYRSIEGRRSHARQDPGPRAPTPETTRKGDRADPFLPDASRYRYLWSIGVIAIAGLSVLAFLAWRSVTIERADPSDALRRFAQVESRLGSSEPMLRIDAGGTIMRRPPPVREPAHLSRLQALAYRVPEQRLVHAVVPFWLLKVKGPAVQYALHDTGLDLKRLGLTPADLEQYGAGIVLDEIRPNGDRLLVWTE